MVAPNKPLTRQRSPWVERGMGGGQGRGCGGDVMAGERITWRTNVYRYRFSWQVQVLMTVGCTYFGPEGGGWYGIAFREKSIPKVEQRVKAKALRKFRRSAPVLTSTVEEHL